MLRIDAQIITVGGKVVKIRPRLLYGKYYLSEKEYL